MQEEPTTADQNSTTTIQIQKIQTNVETEIEPLGTVEITNTPHIDNENPTLLSIPSEELVPSYEFYILNQSQAHLDVVPNLAVNVNPPPLTSHNVFGLNRSVVDIGGYNIYNNDTINYNGPPPSYEDVTGSQPIQHLNIFTVLPPQNTPLPEPTESKTSRCCRSVASVSVFLVVSTIIVMFAYRVIAHSRSIDYIATNSTIEDVYNPVPDFLNP